uniref:Uncharacterized protein n=1 Tax=Acrobeloides nanus TaxID=290746 RepID=A0A914E8S4_9BILA
MSVLFGNNSMAVPLANLKQVFIVLINSGSRRSTSRARASELLKAFLAWDETEKWENAVEKVEGACCDECDITSNF